MSFSGKINLGLNGLTPANLWYPILNAWKMSDEFEVTSSIGSNKQSNLPPNTPNSAWLDSVTGQAYLDSNGELINPLPADATSLIRRFETHSINILPNPFNRAGQPWVFKFDGTSSSVSIALDNVVRVGNRITGTWPNNQSNKQVIVTLSNANDPPRNIRFCPTEWESLLDAGKIFNPDWLSQISIASGILRFMDWENTNSNRSTRTYGDFPTQDFYVWGGGNCSSASTSTYLKGGLPPSVATSLAAQANTSIWFCIPHVFGVAKTARVSSASSALITIASPAVISWAAHGLPADWQIVFTNVGGALPTGITSGTPYYIVGASITADTFQVSASPGGAAVNTSGSQSGTHTATSLGMNQANPPVVVAPNHPFENGDQVIPYSFGGMIQSSTVTITIAVPGVITWTSHPLQANNGVRFSTTVSLPTGIVAGQTYYVVGASILANSFEISATPGGASITTTGTQSGTHTGTTEIVRNTFTVANVTTNTLELSGVNTTGFSAFSSGPGWLTSPYSLSGMTTQMTTLATHFRDNVPIQLTTYFEFSNECWNSIFDAFHWLAAQARTKFANDNSYRMTGYLLAHCMKTIRDVYGTRDRARWRGVMATFSFGTTVTTEMIAGINQYITENPTLTLNDLVNDLAVVGYWGGNLEDNGSAVAVTIDIGTSTFTRSNHGYLEGYPLKFTTTGTLPTPVVVGTIFYAKNVTTNTFQISAASGGAVLTLGGSQLGTHTVMYAINDLSQQWLDDSLTRYAVGLEAAPYTYLDRTVNEDLYDGRYSGARFSIVNSNAILWVPNKAVADSNGLRLIQYEGGNSNALADGGRSANDAWRAAFPNTTQTPADAANYTLMMNEFITLGGVFPAKFTEANPVNIFGSFGAMRWPGDANATWQAVVKFNATTTGRLGR